MIDKFRKLVALAESIATRYNDAGDTVEGFNVHVELNNGFVRVGIMQEHAVYHPDENVYMPEYHVSYNTYMYDWVDNKWVKKVTTYAPLDEDEVDELPF